MKDTVIRRRYTVTGEVQGVGFRYRARYAAQSLGLTGWVENQWDGSVLLELQGPAQLLDTALEQIAASQWIRITGLAKKDLPPVDGERGFHVKG